MRSNRIGVIRCSAVWFMLIWAASPAGAARLHWPNNQYVHISEEQPIEEFLLEFCAGQGILVSISKGVGNQTISGRFDLPPAQVFDQVVGTFSLIWYYDGNILYIYRSDEAISKIIALKHLSTQNLKKILEDMQIPDSRFPIQYYAREKIVHVSGPPQYVSFIENTARVLDDNKRQHSTGDLKGETRTLLMSSKAKVAVANAYLRSGPGLRYTVLEEVTSGTSLIVLGGKQQWLFVHLPGGAYGWISKRLTTLSKFTVVK